MDVIKLFFCGDVMLARGVDMIQKYSCDPKLCEGNALDAWAYVTLAERKNGPIPDSSQRTPSYVWGEALRILEEKKPDLRIINLETSITTSDKPWPRKGIHYRMHPKNVDVITSAAVDCCVLSNNHTADWGMDGLRESLATLRNAGVSYVGAGYDLREAQAPAMFQVPGKGRVLVFGACDPSSGIPAAWLASHQSGVNLINVDTQTSLDAVTENIRKYRKEGDIVVFSIHWGGNWGYEIEPAFKRFAHKLIDAAGVDIIHGHSSHHAIGVEVYKNKLIMYGCGDFINDYEGIGGHVQYRGDLSLMYLVSVEAETGRLRDLTMVPTQIKRLRIQRAEASDTAWLADTMAHECKKLACDVKLEDGELRLHF